MKIGILAIAATIALGSVALAKNDEIPGTYKYMMCGSTGLPLTTYKIDLREGTMIVDQRAYGRGPHRPNDRVEKVDIKFTASAAEGGDPMEIVTVTNEYHEVHGFFPKGTAANSAKNDAGEDDHGFGSSATQSLLCSYSF